MKEKRLSLICACVWAIASVSARAVTLDADISAEVKVTSAYVWRGRVINDEPCIQPSVTVEAGGFSFNVWGTWDLTDVTNASEHTRMDTTLDYTWVHGKQILNSGLSAYIYHDTSAELPKDTFEAFVGYALDVVFLPSLTICYDFGEIEGFYTSVALAHSFELVKDTLALDLGAAVCGADENYFTDSFPTNQIEASLIDLTATASFPITLGDNIELTPAAKYMTLLDPEIKDAVEAVGKDLDQFVYSLTFSVYF